MDFRGRASRRVTLADVAREAGVSVQTASQVLAKTPNVRLRTETRARVEEAAIKVGYKPNRLAQAMRKGRTDIVSLWMPVDRPNITLLLTLNELSRRARESHYDLLIVGLESSVAYGPDSRVPQPWPADGLISFDSGHAIREFRKDPGNCELPTVVLGIEEFDNADTVSWDVIGAAAKTARLAIGQGCRTTLHVTPDWVVDGHPLEQRRLGYRTAVEEAGLEPAFLAIPGETSSVAEGAFSAYLRDNKPPDAIFCFTDQIAVGALAALLQRGVRVPDDCQVWGYGNFPEAAEHRVPISTIGFPIEEMVAQAWVWLMERIAQPDLPARRVSLEMPIIFRSTTGREG